MARDVPIRYSLRREAHNLHYWLSQWWRLIAFVGVVAFASAMFAIKGKCVSTMRGGVLYGVGSGFKPYESYSIDITRNGVPYPSWDSTRNINTNGEADALGHPSYFVWPCDDNYSDGVHDISPPGKYKVTLTMLDTGKQVSATFKVGKAPKS